MVAMLFIVLYFLLLTARGPLPHAHRAYAYDHAACVCLPVYLTAPFTR